MSQEEKQAYFPHLDGIRTIAVLMVVVHHWLEGDSILHYGGSMGVGLFFVLSGFLITTILLRQQLDFQNGSGIVKWNILKTFYIRRTLRIFPIYYLYVSGLVIFGIGSAREIWPWLYGYAYNFLLFFTNNWHSGYVEHLWSLAIEEQYYLVWPALLLFCPPKYNWHLTIGFILLAMGTKAGLYLQNPASQFSKFPVSQFDGFGIGSALALIWRAGMKIRFAWLGFVIFWGLSFFMKMEWLHFHGKSLIGQVFPLYFIGCGFLIYAAAEGIKKPFSWFFNSPLVMYMGKISYGIYLYHLFVPDLIKYLIAFFNFPEPGETLNWVLFCLATMAICSASWHWIEQPVNRMKNRFRYSIRK
ncbi:MAG TPA: acyltransferase [Catalimonadaceae bacterium]|jgi:peptidoglycan/LPS O-acetylase OafA/YrhL|nr:acyltransferase [Catalimonadaceae bacterium]